MDRTFVDPSNVRSETEIFDELKCLAAKQGFIHALGLISSRDHFVEIGKTVTKDDVLKSYAPGRTIRTEFETLQGLMLQGPQDHAFPGEESVKEYIAKAIELLAEMHAAFNRPMIEKLSASMGSTTNPFANAESLREPIFYGGETAYSFQYRDFAAARYDSDKEWFLENVGFEPTDAQKILFAIEAYQRTMISSATIRLKRAKRLSRDLLEGFMLPVGKIGKIAKVSEDRVEAFLEKMSPSPDEKNEDFNEIGDFNIVAEKPLVKIDGNFYCLNQYSITQSIYDSPFYWMISDKDYARIASKHRGEFTEEAAAHFLARVFSDEHIHKNVNLFEKKSAIAAEVDILVTFGNVAIIVQCKSKKLTVPSRKGNDQKLKDDFAKAIQSAYDQGIECAKFILENRGKAKDSEDRNVDIGEIDTVFILCVESEHYPALTVQADYLLKIDETSGVEHPMVFDIFLLDILTEFLRSPLYFLDYLKKRSVSYGRVSSISELVILAYHLRKNLFLTSEYDFIILDENIACELDAALAVRRQGLRGSDTPSGLLTKIPANLSEILKVIEDSPEPNLVSFGRLILGLNEDTQRALSSAIRSVSERAKRDGRLHDATFFIDKEVGGITLHSSSASKSEARERLYSHSQIRKYSTKSNAWYGLFLSPETGMPEVGYFTDEDWKYDKDLAEISAEMPAKSVGEFSGGKFRRKKIGRNEPCPCGSGKKFKKCCIDR